MISPQRKMIVAIWLLLGGAIVLSMAATQYIAWRLAWHPALGSPLIGQIHAPWRWLDWQARFGAVAPEIFQTLQAGLGLAGMLISAGLLALASASHRKPKRHDGIHGTAHWASPDEVAAAGLLNETGVHVGGWRDERGRLRILRHDGPEHVAAIAPTRSGKGVGLVVPTLLTWPHSLVVNDQKGELWNLTAGWRARAAGNQVLRFDPGAAEGSTRFNPLDEIRLGTIHEVGDVQNLVTILVDPEGKGLIDHWAKTSHAFLTGAILHVLYAARETGARGSLPDVALALSDPERPIDGLYRDMRLNCWASGRTHPTIAAAVRDMTNRPEDERGSVLSTAMSFLSLYRDPLIARNVSASDFAITDLMNSERPVTLYLLVRAEDKDRMKPLMRLIINQLMRVLLRPEITYRDGRPIRPHRHRLLMMLDEFPSYGKLEVFQEALAYIAGYGIKAYLICQDIAQLWGAYGRDESLISNCHIRVAFAPNKIETAEWLSRMAGTTTIVKEDVTVSGRRQRITLENVSTTFHQIARALMTPDEIMRLKGARKDAADAITEPGDMLIFASGHAPILGTQTLYFQDAELAERARLPPPGTRAQRKPFRLITRDAS